VLIDCQRRDGLNIAWGYDEGDLFAHAHITTNVSPGQKRLPIDLSFTSDLSAVLDPATGTRRRTAPTPSSATAVNSSDGACPSPTRRAGTRHHQRRGRSGYHRSRRHEAPVHCSRRHPARVTSALRVASVVGGHVDCNGRTLASRCFTNTLQLRAACAGESTVSKVEEAVVRFVPATVPKSNSAAPVEFMPVTVTRVVPSPNPRSERCSTPSLAKGGISQ
jgi:hypothetical protein